MQVELTEAQLRTIVNIKRLRKTFSKVLPDLQIHSTLVVFFCESIPELVTYSIQDGHMVCRRNQASSIIEGLMQIKCSKTPCNNVDAPTLQRIKTGFELIHADAPPAGDPDYESKVDELRARAHELFDKKYK